MIERDIDDARFRVWGEGLTPWVSYLMAAGGIAVASGAVVLAAPTTAAAQPAAARSVQVPASASGMTPSIASQPLVAPAPPTAAECVPVVVGFGFAASSIEPAEEATLNALADSLRDEPTATILVHGHADAYGKEDANLALSKARATTVANRFLARGVDRSRMTVRGFGAYQPIEGSPEEAASNRRVVIYVKGTRRCGGAR